LKIYDLATLLQSPKTTPDKQKSREQKNRKNRIAKKSQEIAKKSRTKKTADEKSSGENGRAD
jgi:hypothetical protein